MSNTKRSGSAAEIQRESGVSYKALAKAARLMKEQEARSGGKLLRAVGEEDDTALNTPNSARWSAGSKTYLAKNAVK